MATIYDDELDKYRSPGDSRMQQEDNKNMSIARQIGGWGTGMTGAPPSGQEPYGVPGMAIPKNYGAIEEALTKSITSPVGAIPQGATGDTEEAMRGFPSALSGRAKAIMDRLGGKLRRSTRANLTNELNSISGTLAALSGQATSRDIEQAKMQEGRAASAIPGLSALTGMRKQALEETATPYELSIKRMSAEAQAARDRSAAEFGATETEKTRKEMAIMPDTPEQAIKIHRQMNKPYADKSTAINEEAIYKRFQDAAIEDAKNRSLPNKPVSPNFAAAEKEAEAHISRRKDKLAQAEAVTSPDKFVKYMRSKGSQLSEQKLINYYNEKGYAQYATGEE
jgi:hypothetical protein